MDNNFNKNPNQGYPNQGYPNQGYPMNNMYMKTDRSLLTVILLSIVTCGIYQIFFWSKVGDDINIIASRRDGQKTMHYCLMSFVLAPITCGIYAFVWWHKLSNRIGEEARSRGIQTGFDAGTFWLWFVLGSCLCGIGPLIYMHKLCTTMNYISADYNQRGF